MGLLTSASQVLYGTKTFANDVVIKGKLRLEGEITRTNRASFKLDKSGTTTDWGTWKRIAAATVLSNWNPTTTPQTNTVNVEAYVPAGTKAIGGWFNVSSSAVGDTVGIREKGGSSNVAFLRTQVANQAITMWFEVQLDSSYTFDVVASHLNISDVDVVVTKVAL